MAVRSLLKLFESLTHGNATQPSIPNRRSPSEPKSSTPSPPPTPTVGEDEWQCQLCTLINKRSRPGCFACGSERPIEAMPEDGPERRFYIDAQKIIPSKDTFECPVCFCDTDPEDGVQLRECHCDICMSCLKHGIKAAKTGEFKCPNCQQSVCERDMRNAVSPSDWEKFEKFMLKHVEAKTTTSFHCLTPDCIGWVEVETQSTTSNDHSHNSRFFMCPCCKKVNCIVCKAVHEGKTCEEHRNAIIKKQKDNEKSTNYLKELLANGEAMECPDCKSIIQRIDGCGYLECTVCGLPLCWHTKKRRWGPKGRGDTSDGCRCEVNGVKCHPDCGWCHGH